MRIHLGIPALLGLALAPAAGAAPLVATAPETGAVLVALAQDDGLTEEEDSGAVDDATAPPSSGEVQVGGSRVGESVGGAVGFVRSTGFYTASDLGGFLVFGGFVDDEVCGFRCAERGKSASPTSNLQPFIGLSVGYDVSDWLGVQASFGTGFVGNSAPVSGTADSPRDYGITFLNLGATATWWIDRIGLLGRVFGGGALLQPPPLPGEFPLGGNAGVGVGIRWATLLTNVTVGADVNYYATFAQAGGAMTLISGLGFAPVIKYHF
ncbi:MAG: adventurous gliding motility protein CglE [Myxococcota bacterium]